MALKLEHPSRVEATTTALDDEVTAMCGGICTFHFAASGDRPALRLTWYDGGLQPATPDLLDPTDPKQFLGEGRNGLLFVGEKGLLTCGGWAKMPRLLPMSLHKDYKRPEKTLPRVKGHHADWLAACKGGPPPSGNFEYSARLTELTLLGNVALRSKKLLVWDGPNMRATNAPEADRFIREEYRQGWELV